MLSFSRVAATSLAFLFAVCAFQVRRCSAHDFVAVLFDDDSAKSLKVDAPLPRRLKAELIDRLVEAGARGLVLKFFEDLPSDAEQDRLYAQALCKLPTVLQACLCSDGTEQALPTRFALTHTNKFWFKSVLADVQGYIPLEQFSACARGIGFVDLIRPEGIPLVESYRGQFVPSFYVSALELETGEHANFSSGTNVVFGTRRLSLNQDAEHTVAHLPSLDYIAFRDVLNGVVAKERLKSKVVIVGYEGDRIHKIATKWGEIGAHRLFIQSLFALHRDLQDSTKK
jgi:hypothetical protein